RSCWSPASSSAAIFCTTRLIISDDFHSWFQHPCLCPLLLIEDWSLMQEEEVQQGRWRRSPRAPDSRRTSRRNLKRIKSSRDCRLEKKEMRVRDLGLGYDSDEIVLFKYCVGTCHSFRKNYDLALKALMDNGSIPGKNVSSHPCCRPTRYETVSFMDTQTSWQTIKWLSAANCSCVS
uniref:TGF-beta family profile domain-containing protein n=1 Tax=Anabas testudineus TaxID=64144 RepID=A0A3Q1HPX3_ANATE